MTQPIEDRLVWLKHGSEQDRQGRNVLQLAAARGDTEVVRLLIGKGEDPNKKNRYGNTPLIEAGLVGHVETAALLIDSGVDIDAVNKDGETALIVSVIGYKIPVLRLLLEKGADIERRNRSGHTALDTARERKQGEMVRLLEEAQDRKRHEAAAQKQQKLNSLASRPRIIRRVQP
jgi:ankyrin repeat protein